MIASRSLGIMFQLVGTAATQYSRTFADADGAVVRSAAAISAATVRLRLRPCKGANLVERGGPGQPARRRSMRAQPAALNAEMNFGVGTPLPVTSSQPRAHGEARVLVEPADAVEDAAGRIHAVRVVRADVAGVLEGPGDV